MQNEWVILMGSHRSNGHSAQCVQTLQKDLLAKGAKLTVYDINCLHVEPCIDCVYCKNHYGRCVHKDDMAKVYASLKTATQVVFVTPVYFNGLPSKFKALVDRIQMIFMCDYAHQAPFVASCDRNSKRAHLIAFGGARPYPNQYTGVELPLDLVLKNLRMQWGKKMTFSGTDHQRHFPLVDQNISAWMEGVHNE